VPRPQAVAPLWSSETQIEEVLMLATIFGDVDGMNCLEKKL
jgi:hypothetical protein